MAKEYDIRQTLHLIWYNLPNGASTFSRCATDGCEESARGGGKCLKCAQDQLADLTSEDYATAYVATVKKLRMLERNMVEEHCD